MNSTYIKLKRTQRKPEPNFEQNTSEQWNKLIKLKWSTARTKQ